MQVEGVTERLATAIKLQKTSRQVQEDQLRASDFGAEIITFADPDYPRLLRHIHDPPPVLYVYGTLQADFFPLAVVGSRNATPYGRRVTERLSGDLAELGFTVVSGMAAGIDTAAHRGTIAKGGRTVAVLGCGLDTIYPAQNKRLFHRIAERGAVITEFPFKTRPEPHHFPIRNRIISGMSLGTVIVEASQRSGSLITARLAAEQGREVFAVPGSVTSFKSMGTHYLIKQGAKLVEHANDILDELGPIQVEPGDSKPKETHVQLSLEEETVLRELSPYPMHIDRLIRRLPFPPARVAGLLIQLELKGLVMQSPGKLFASCESPGGGA